jgi:hypothetical protein
MSLEIFDTILCTFKYVQMIEMLCTGCECTGPGIRKFLQFQQPAMHSLLQFAGNDIPV